MPKDKGNRRQKPLQKLLQKEFQAKDKGELDSMMKDLKTKKGDK